MHSSGTALTEAPRTRSFAEVADGLMAQDPNEAVRVLREACPHLEDLGLRIDLGRALLDLGRAERQAGIDARHTFDRAREILVACDVRAFLPEAEAELART